MPNQNLKESGSAALVFIITFTLLTLTAITVQIPLTEEYPQNTQVAVLGDVKENLATDQLKAEPKKLMNDPKRAEEDLRRLEIEKEKLKQKEEKLKIERQRKEELLKKQQSLREAAAKQKLEQAKASESAELEKELQANELKLESGLEDNKVVLEQQYGDLKLIYKYENNKIVVKAKAENGAEIEVDDPQIKSFAAQLEQQLNQKGIGSATGSANLKIGNKFKAKTSFPITVDPETNQLIVTTPTGQKIVAVLPDEAVENMLSRNILNEIGNPEDLSGSEAQEIELSERGDEIIYKIKGKKNHKVFGLFPISTTATAFVSAENGELIAKEESAFARILSFISF